jgi:predicted metal-binding membrane protein
MRGHTSIWLFSGILLLTYGVIIMATGLWELGHPLAHPPVLYELHAPIWWGAIMTVAGLFYTIRFRKHL